jgi:hypothetical protein
VATSEMQISSLAVDVSEIFFTVKEDLESPRDLVALLRGEHRLRTLSRDAGYDLASDADRIYMLLASDLGSQLVARPKHGGDWHPLGPTVPRAVARAIAHGTAYIASRPVESPGKIVAISATGGDVRDVAVAEVLWDGLAAQGGHVCWLAVDPAPRYQVAETVSCVTRGGAVTQIASAQPAASALAIADDSVYWLVRVDGEVEVRRKVIAGARPWLALAGE